MQEEPSMRVLFCCLGGLTVLLVRADDFYGCIPSRRACCMAAINFAARTLSID